MLNTNPEKSGVPMDVATLEKICDDAMRRISRAQHGFVVTCDNRPPLREMHAADIALFTAALASVGMKIAHAGVLPDADPATFLASMAKPEKVKGGGVLARIRGRLQGSTNADPLEAVRDALSQFLAMYPGFDPEAFRAGRPLDREFMAEYAIDHATIREISFECRKPFSFIMQNEDNFSDMIRIHDRFKGQVFLGNSSEAIEEFQAMNSSLLKIDVGEDELTYS